MPGINLNARLIPGIQVDTWRSHTWRSHTVAYVDYPVAYVDYPVAYVEYPVAYVDFGAGWVDWKVGPNIPWGRTDPSEMRVNSMPGPAVIVRTFAHRSA